jgi:DNA-binding GntR family transcriptional regulator
LHLERISVYSCPVPEGSRDNTAAIHRQLREAILRGEIAAGAELSQVKLADEFGVSRGPVREALRLLEREGLVDAELNRRVRVAPFSPGDLEEVYALRIVNEALAIRATVPHLTPEDLASLHADMDRMEALSGTDIVDWEPVHRHFHHTLVAYGGQRLVSLIQQLSDHAERYRLVYLPREPRAWSVGAAEHREIVAACEAREEARAAELLARHLARTAGSMLMHVAPDHDPALMRNAVRAVTHAEPTTRPTRVALQRT